MARTRRGHLQAHARERRGQRDLLGVSLQLKSRARATPRPAFDLGAEKTGVYTVVTGYPSKAKLTAARARVHVCAAKPATSDQPPCHDVVRSGSVTVTKLDPAEGGRVEGTYEVVLADGTLRGTFSAYRCN